MNEEQKRIIIGKIKNKVLWASCQDNLTKEDMLRELEDNIIQIIFEIT